MVEMSYGQTSSILWGPTMLTRTRGSRDGLEVSVHTLPKPLEREFNHCFDERSLNFDQYRGLPQDADEFRVGDAEFLAIPTNQRARHDLVGVGDDIEREKDRLLNRYMEFARLVCEKIRSRGYWADYIDPCSGLPFLSLNCNKVYSEVDGMECCLGYRAYNAGFCKILVHPVWGSSVYPATMFAYAPRKLVKDILASLPVMDSKT
jgi:Methylmalonic aciduria and homocystinuria type D protein